MKVLGEYTNKSKVVVRLLQGDVREASNVDAVVFGRNRVLRRHYEEQAGHEFRAATDTTYSLQFLDYHSNGTEFVISAPCNRGTTRQVSEGRHVVGLTDRTYHAVSKASELLKKPPAGRGGSPVYTGRIALVPLTWRAPDRVAFCTVYALWALTVFVIHGAPLYQYGVCPIPERIDIVADKGIESVMNVLDNAEYADMGLLSDNWPRSKQPFGGMPRFKGHSFEKVSG
ncbi:MAG: hypothetical protein GF331_08300 [Chitinivibrionales bacterium]|nr:hypothetical protein [Chitinivibrionales bacterium]